MSKDRLDPAPSVEEAIAAFERLCRGESQQYTEDVQDLALCLSLQASKLRRQMEITFPNSLLYLAQDNRRAMIDVLNLASSFTSESSRSSAYRLFSLGLHLFGHTGKQVLRNAIRHLLVAILANHQQDDSRSGPFFKLLAQEEETLRVEGDEGILGDFDLMRVSALVRLRLKE